MFEHLTWEGIAGYSGCSPFPPYHYIWLFPRLLALSDDNSTMKSDLLYGFLV